MKLIMLCLAVLICSSCTTARSVGGSSGSDLQALSSSSKLELINKTINVRTRNKLITDAKVLSTTENSVITDKGEIRFTDIQDLGVKQVSVGKTAAGVAAGGVFAGAVIIGTIITVGGAVLIVKMVES